MKDSITKSSLATIYSIINEKKSIMESPLMAILSEIQATFGYIDLEVQEIVAKELNISKSDVYGVVSFYSYFSMKPKGKYVIGVCLGTACYVKGTQAILDEFCSKLGIKEGETSDDGLFSIDVLRCIGACGLAPVVSVNGKVYPHVEIKDVAKIIKEYKDKEVAVDA